MGRAGVVVPTHQSHVARCFVWRCERWRGLQGIQNRDKNGQSGGGERETPAVDNILKPGLPDVSTGVCRGKSHRVAHTRKTTGLLWQLLQPGTHLFPLLLHSIRHSETAWRKTARTEGSRRFHVLLRWDAGTGR